MDAARLASRRSERGRPSGGIVSLEDPMCDSLPRGLSVVSAAGFVFPGRMLRADRSFSFSFSRPSACGSRCAKQNAPRRITNIESSHDPCSAVRPAYRERANRTARTTSMTDSANTTTAGRWSTIRFHARRRRGRAIISRYKTRHRRPLPSTFRDRTGDGVRKTQSWLPIACARSGHGSLSWC